MSPSPSYVKLSVNAENRPSFHVLDVRVLNACFVLLNIGVESITGSGTFLIWREGRHKSLRVLIDTMDHYR